MTPIKWSSVKLGRLYSLWTNPCSDIGDVREFPGACAILNEEKLKEQIECNCHEKLKIETAKLIAQDSSLTLAKPKSK